MDSNSPETPNNNQNIARNEPCPCGSGKKYKRCCGVAAAPKITPPKAAAEGAGAGAGGMPGGMPGMDQMTPEMQQQMLQMGQMLQRLPRGQMQRLQSIVQKAMSGKDVSREAEEFQKTLPVEFQSMLGMMAPALAAAQGGMGAQAPSSEPQMSEEEARAIVEKAAAEGKISSDQAETLLKEKEKKGVLGKLWGKK